MKANVLIATLLVAATLGALNTAEAQVAGSTTVGISVTDLTQVALGWSVKKTILGKAVYNEVSEKIGNVEDVIIAPDRNVSYLIIGAGGFVGIGRHDVAIPIGQIQDKGGKLVVPGATKDIVKSMPRFDYADDTTRRAQFIASAEQDIAKAKAKIADLEKKTAGAAADTKGKLDQQLAGLKNDLKAADERLAEVKRAGVIRWKEFEGDASVAMAHLRKWLG